MTSTASSLATCTIAQGRITLNNQVLLDLPNLDFGSFIKQAYRALDWSYPKFHKMDRLCKLATITGRYLLQDGALKEYMPSEIALVIANAQSTLHTDSKHVASIADRNAYYPSPSVFVYTLPNILVGELCIQYNIKGQSTFFIQEQPDWDFLWDYSQLLLQDKGTKICLTGWVDYTEQGYHATLHLIPPHSTNQQL